MMTTPTDLEDFAIGFALTEGIVEALSDIRGVEIERAEQGLKVNVALVAKQDIDRRFDRDVAFEGLADGAAVIAISRARKGENAASSLGGIDEPLGDAPQRETFFAVLLLPVGIMVGSASG